jgi:NitT/TauT family transport system ATP-binding protein
MSDILVFRNVAVEYGEKVVLEKVRLRIEQGAFVSVVGPSGAGKSTFLRLVLGQEAPARGSIELDGKKLRAEPSRDRGVVFQRYSVFPHLNALDNVLFGLDCRGSMFRGRLKGARRAAARDEAAALLDQVGLGAAMEVYPAQLSGGMQQRLAIAQALIMRPRILLLDEPFGALDPGVRLDMHALITDLWRGHNLTVLMVTHDIKEAFKLGTRVIALDKIRHDPQAQNRYGSTVVYDFPLDMKGPRAVPPELASLSAPPEATGILEQARRAKG